MPRATAGNNQPPSPLLFIFLFYSLLFTGFGLIPIYISHTYSFALGRTPFRLIFFYIWKLFMDSLYILYTLGLLVYVLLGGGDLKVINTKKVFEKTRARTLQLDKRRCHIGYSQFG
ncbi:hypothetical protein F4809DRAFT_296337 [Biscogniauxia mediterranea]|nr:hypothetical protein F4809DRAFT_296337 [Biscogniauxia mediterranea]